MLNIIRPLLQRLTNFVPSYGLPMLLASYSASTPNNVSQMGLEEFFDRRENWGNASVRSGRPWRKDELRIKSNADLHKLWYVLLKERNMLMTMEAEHYRCLERMPNPERLEKVS
ncbi:unnamed protein product [Dicrocoelium dendriticum]|nr:unnamed protein product [Dicrocoelium dendriticum]